MNWRQFRLILGATALPLMLASLALAGDRVAIQVSPGQFLGVRDEGTLCLQRFIPINREIFELVSCGEGQIALKTAAGRWLVPWDPYGRLLWAGSLAAEPGAWETLQLVPVEGNRAAFKVPWAGGFVSFDPDVLTRAPAVSVKPSEAQTVAIYRVTELPEGLQSTLSSLIGKLAAEELTDKQYDKTRTRKKQRQIELPAPTLRDPGRKKKRYLWSTTEEYQVKARLDGEPQIGIRHMTLLEGYPHSSGGKLMFVVEATLPVQGQVRYRLADLMSATTNFRATVRLTATGQVSPEKSAGKSGFNPPELVDLQVIVTRLDLSNDLANLGRALIEDIVNHELRDSEDRIREKANTSIRKALEAHPIRLPLLRYFGLG